MYLILFNKLKKKYIKKKYYLIYVNNITFALQFTILYVV